MSNHVVHYCCYASQPDLQMWCNLVWTTPKWGNAETWNADIYIADNGMYYAFNKELVNCPDCLNKGAKNDKV